MKTLGLLALVCVCSACASKPASSISQAVVDDLSLATVRDDSDAYLGSTVRWGGMVTEVENKADSTLVFVVARDLKDNEKPITDSSSEGRFVARFTGFVDPLVYRAGRPLTVVGRIDGSLLRPIGEYDYQFPLVVVRDSHLWADPGKTRKYYPPPPWWYNNYYYHPFPHRHSHW